MKTAEKVRLLIEARDRITRVRDTLNGRSEVCGACKLDRAESFDEFQIRKRLSAQITKLERATTWLEKKVADDEEPDPL